MSNQAIEQAFRIATSGRPGPVHIDLPKDISSGKIWLPKSFLEGELPKEIKMETFQWRKPLVDLQQIQQLAHLINQAKRPVLYVGQGAVGAADQVRELAAKASIPVRCDGGGKARQHITECVWWVQVATTIHGMGVFDEEDPLSLHMLGMHGSAYGNLAIQKADLVIAMGSRFDDRTTGMLNKYAPEVRHTHTHREREREPMCMVTCVCVVCWSGEGCGREGGGRDSSCGYREEAVRQERRGTAHGRTRRLQRRH